MFADIFIPQLDSVDMEHMRALLERAGFQILSERELTSQVLNARALVSQHPVSREALEKVPEENRPALREAFFYREPRATSLCKKERPITVPGFCS